MQGDVVLPAFELDCRNWLVGTPDAGLPDEVGGAPLVAVLSTAVFAPDRFHCVSGVLTVGLLDEDLPAAVWSGGAGGSGGSGGLGGSGGGCVAAELVDPDGDAGSLRYLLPSPDGRLALLAEFTTGGPPDGPLDPELTARVEALMASFRWAA